MMSYSSEAVSVLSEEDISCQITDLEKELQERYRDAGKSLLELAEKVDKTKSLRKK